MQSTALLDAALDYADRGWRVVPLHNTTAEGKCSCNREDCGQRNRGKHPRLTGWPAKASAKSEQIEEWWERWPDANVGVMLGPGSGIIDVECDTPEAEAALAVLFEKESIVVPTFTSGRGKHRLFRWTEDLPEGKQDKAKFDWRGIEFRVGGGDKGAQSVFPPSMHHSGQRYTWLVRPDEVDLVPLPDSVILKLLCDVGRTEKPKDDSSRNGKHFKETARENIEAAGEEPRSTRWKLYEQEQVLETIDGRDDVIFREACAQWNEQTRLKGQQCIDDSETQAVVFTRVWGLNLAKCRPPLERDTVQVKCESARKFAKQNVNANAGISLTALGLEYRDGEWFPGQWRLETVNSDPPIARLFAPFLTKRFVEMTMGDFDQPVMVHRHVLAATGRVCLDDRPGFFKTVWNGDAKRRTRGVKAKLIETSTQIEAPRDVKRQAVIASKLLDQLSRARTVEEGQHPDGSGRPSKMCDGGIVFKFESVLEPMANSADKINRNELSKVLQDVGTAERPFGSGRESRYYKVVTSEVAKKLEQMAGRAGHV